MRGCASALRDRKGPGTCRCTGPGSPWPSCPRRPGQSHPAQQGRTCPTASSGLVASAMAVKAMTATAESSGSGSGHAPRSLTKAGRGSASKRLRVLAATPMVIRADSTMKLASSGIEPSGAVAATAGIRPVLRATSRCPLPHRAGAGPASLRSRAGRPASPRGGRQALTVTSSRACRDGDAPIRRWSHVRLASFQRCATMAVTSAPPAAASSAASSCERAEPPGSAGSRSSELSAWPVPGEIASTMGPLAGDSRSLPGSTRRSQRSPPLRWSRCPGSSGLARYQLGRQVLLEALRPLSRPMPAALPLMSR